MIIATLRKLMGSGLFRFGDPLSSRRFLDRHDRRSQNRGRGGFQINKADLLRTYPFRAVLGLYRQLAALSEPERFRRPLSFTVRDLEANFSCGCSGTLKISSNRRLCRRKAHRLPGWVPFIGIMRVRRVVWS